MRVSVPGVATGLAWTPVGGDILVIRRRKRRATAGSSGVTTGTFRWRRAHLEFVWQERVDDAAAAAFEAQASAETLRSPGLQPAPP